MARRRSNDWQHWAAPTAFLAIATIAIVLVASSHTKRSTDEPPVPTTSHAAKTTSAKRHTTTAAGARRTYTVVAGDTYGVIAEKTGTTVAELERLNPGVSSTSLHVGQTLRVA
jgi:LysM repeat protein